VQQGSLSNAVFYVTGQAINVDGSRSPVL